MELFVDLISKILPLYVLVLLGYLAGRYFKVNKESIASLLIFFIVPFVIFNGVVTASPDRSIMLLPLLSFSLATIMSIAFYNIGKMYWQGPEKNILAFGAGTGNAGYFGLPLVLALFGEQYLSVAVLLILGISLFENSIGYYFVARGNFLPRDAIMRVLRLPTLYAFIVGVLFLALHISIYENASTLFAHFRGAYSVLGMMLVGIGLAGVAWSDVDKKFLLLSFASKFLVWPAAAISLILLDINTFHFFSASVYPIMLTFSIVPLASNTVAYASQLNTVPEKAAVAVVSTTLFALIYIPFFVAFVFPLIL